MDLITPLQVARRSHTLSVLRRRRLQAVVLAVVVAVVSDPLSSGFRDGAQTLIGLRRVGSGI